MKRCAWLVLLLALSGCTCGGGPPEGQCTGTWGGVSLEGAGVDPESRFVNIERTTCTEADLKVYDVSWGGQQVKLSLSFRSGGPSVLGPAKYDLPPAPGTFLSFTLSPQTPSPTGTLELGIAGLAGRRTGTLSLSSATEQLTCTFDLPFDSEGERMSCGGSDADFD